MLHVIKSVRRYDLYRLTQGEVIKRLEYRAMPNVMAALTSIGGALCSTSQSLADAHY